MNGILNILKPPGMTSHDVVSQIRRITGIKRIGHTGTLDPAAAGVLVILIGKATRLSEYLVVDDKIYRGEITFGVTTDTQDSTGNIIERQNAVLERESIEKVFASFIGEQQQIPPMVSAVKYKGKRLYKLARQGKKINLPPRKVYIYTLRLLKYNSGCNNRLNTRVLFECHCSKGTYIRTLASDIGEHMGCGGHLSFLVRTKTGPFNLEESITIERLTKERDINSLLLPMSCVLSGLPVVFATLEQEKDVSVGKDILLNRSGEEKYTYFKEGITVRIESKKGRLLAIAEVGNVESSMYIRLKMNKVFI